MKERITGTTLLVLLFSCPLCAANVEWIDGFGAVAPAQWSISPSSPSPGTVISFAGPTDKSYGNSCMAEGAFGGKPYLSINSVNKTIELRFQGPAPTMCILIHKPAVGFKGQFGPLTPGEWVFKSTKTGMTFELNFTVGNSGNVIHVDQHAPLAIWLPDGSSWVRAFTNLQDGLAVAQSGDTIHVADGTYVPDAGTGITPGDRRASFEIPDSVTVLGGFAGHGAPDPDAQNVDLHPTVLNGDLNGDDLWGLLNKDENSFHVVSASGSGSLEGVSITAGHANGTGNNRYGGGVFLLSSDFVVHDCKIFDNKADFGAGAACVAGVTPIFLNTEITGNRAYILGGALYNEDANVELTNCLVTGNTAGSADILGSDAIFNAMGSLDITNCTIADNRPGHLSPPNERAIMNAVWGPGFVDTVSIKNSIVRNGGNEIWSAEAGIVTLFNNNIEGGTGVFNGVDNIDEDPLFKNPGEFGIEGQWFFNDDAYTLLAGSPSIDAGNQALLPVGVGVDLMGNTRIQSGQIDQGAYEYLGFPPLPPAVVLVPNVVNKTQGAAQSDITSAGLAVGAISKAYSSTVSFGRVISQNPAGGATAVVGSAVNLRISKGSPPGGSWTLLSSNDISAPVSDPPPIWPTIISGSGGFVFYPSEETDYKYEISGIAAVGGTWSITPTSGTVPAGPQTVTYTFQGSNVDLSSLPPGERKVAEVKFYTRPHE